MNTLPLGPLREELRNLLIILDGGMPNSLTQEFRWILHDFEANKADLRPEHAARLDNLIEYILLPHADASWVVDIVGRASQTDTDAHNLALGFNRAQTVRSYLLGHGVSEWRMPEARSEGMRVPYIDAPGQEEPLNRSVEIVWRWRPDLVKPPPGYDPGASRRWNINLGLINVNFGLFLGGQYIQGELTKRHPDGDEKKPINVFLLGLDLSGPIFFSATSTPVGTNGDFELDEAVNWDWFNLQYVGFAGVEVSAGGAANASYVRIGWARGVNVGLASAGGGSPVVGAFFGAGVMNIIGGY